jgi:hypothetical protein
MAVQTEWIYYDSNPLFSVYLVDTEDGKWLGADDDQAHIVWKMRSKGEATDLLLADNTKAFYWIGIEYTRVRGIFAPGPMVAAPAEPPHEHGPAPVPRPTPVRAGNNGRRRSIR